MSIYAVIAAAILPVLPDFSVGGSTWTVYRASGDGPSEPITVAIDGDPRTAYIVRNDINKRALALPDVLIYTAEWLCFAELGTDLQVDDILVSEDDNTRVFSIAGDVTTDLGLILAPLATATLPS